VRARLFLAFSLSLVCRPASAITCEVRCPAGYDGSCVRSSDGCACTCDASAKGIQGWVKGKLQIWGASPKSLEATDKAFKSYGPKIAWEQPIYDKTIGKEYLITFVPAKTKTTVKQ